MRWLVCLIALLMLPGCDDDSTGPGSGSSIVWREVTVPAVVDEGFVVAMAEGGGRVVALVHSLNGEWVLEEMSAGWTPVFDKPLPFPPVEPAAPRAPFYLQGSQDLVVSDEGRIYVVGADEAPGALYGTAIRTPAIWYEGETDWVLTSGPEDAGILLEAEWVPSGIEALGSGITHSRLLHLHGTPEAGLSWGYHQSPNPEQDESIADMVVDGTSVYVGGGLYSSEPDESFSSRPLVWRGDGSDFIPLEPPCGECEGLWISTVAMSGGTVYWGGQLMENLLPGNHVIGTGWLAAYDVDSEEWTGIELPAEIKQVMDILVRGTTLFLAVQTTSGGSEIYRSTGRGFVSEPLPEDGFVSELIEAGDRRVLGAGGWTRYPERGAPLIVERTEESR